MLSTVGFNKLCVPSKKLVAHNIWQKFGKISPTFFFKQTLPIRGEAKFAKLMRCLPDLFAVCQMPFAICQKKDYHLVDTKMLVKSTPSVTMVDGDKNPLKFRAQAKTAFLFLRLST